MNFESPETAEEARESREFARMKNTSAVFGGKTNAIHAGSTGTNLSLNGAASPSPGQAPAPPWVLGGKGICPVGAASLIFIKLPFHAGPNFHKSLFAFIPVHSRATAGHRENRRAFSLLELLVVIAIIALTSTMAITSISGIQRSSAMTTSASHLMDYLATGRQIAMTMNQPVRVWVCPGETNDFVLLYRTTNGTDYSIPAERELKLNERVTLKSTTWSTVLATCSTGKETNKGRGDAYFFRFMPDGSTDLAETNSPTLTLVYRTDANSSTLPPNFFTLQIDQQTGTVRTFRPQ